MLWSSAVKVNQPNVSVFSLICVWEKISQRKLSDLLQATEGMRSSRFCLHLAGDTPSSCRLFDIIVSHCVPVIISDRIELPFEDDLDYHEFSVFLSAEKAVQPGFLLRTLRSITEERWLHMWETLKAIAHHFEYQHPAKQDDAVNMIFKQVQRKVAKMKLSIHRSQRLRVADGLTRWNSSFLLILSFKWKLLMWREMSHLTLPFVVQCYCFGIMVWKKESEFRCL